MSFSPLFPVFRSRKAEPDVFHDLRSEVGRVFDQFYSQTPLSSQLDLAEVDVYTIRPSLDVVESDTEMEISLDVPGVKEEDLDIHLDGRLLTVKGSRSTENTEEKKDYKIIERSSGSFQRAIRLPFDPASDDIKAKLDAGVLHVTLKKPENMAEGVKKINVNNGAK